MLHGVIIKESFKNDDVPDFLLANGFIVSVTKEEVDNAAEGQPKVWTLAKFEVPEEKADFIANEISQGLSSGKWYVDFKSDKEVYVVFAGKIFHYTIGDKTGKQQAIDYARSVGIPESQLDWEK